MPLSFLMRLLHTQLPVQVVEPDEIRDVSVLMATGLIEAKITSLESAGPYARTASMATVAGITEEGFAEIAKLGDIRNFTQRSMRFARGARLM
jgi:hypothetical protein